MNPNEETISPPTSGGLNPAANRLFDRFAELGITAPTVPYPAHKTVEEGKQLRGEMSGRFTKNLLLKDKKDRLYLLSIDEDRALDLKTLHTHIGASGRLGFAAQDRMTELLGVAPGALTPLGLINDRDRVVVPIIDASLMDAEQVNFHPLVNDRSTGLSPAELLMFIASCGHEARIVDLDASGS
jgi:Ala-tRNA(Pro) deacylase